MILWAIVLVLLATRASILDTPRQWLALRFPRYADEVLSFLHCPLCFGFWLCLPVLFIDWRQFPACYLAAVFAVAIYDRLRHGLE